MTQVGQRGDLLLGVDGGGTSTTAWLADDSGRVLGRGSSGPSNPKAIGFDAAFNALEAATDAAFADAGRPFETVAVACLGLAGFAQAGDRDRLSKWTEQRQVCRRLLPVSDGALVLAAGTPEGWGVAVIAGTGSIAVGTNRERRIARAGGWGYLLGDEGSAYAVVLAALRRCARRADGRELKTSHEDALSMAMMGALGVTEPAELVAAIHAPGMNRTQIAGLAPVILEASVTDPRIVHDLLEPAGVDLGVTAHAVARSLGIEAGPLPIAMAGGFLLRSESVRTGLLHYLQREGYDPEASMVPDPVKGALILARQSLEGGEQ